MELITDEDAGMLEDDYDDGLEEFLRVQGGDDGEDIGIEEKKKY